jgi:hypothetical protein
MNKDLEAISLMRLVNRLKKKFIAVILTDIEREFRYVEVMQRQANEISEQIAVGDAINTDKLIYLLERIDAQMPTYYIVRKVVLDNINEFARNIFQALIGDIEGYK